MNTGFKLDTQKERCTKYAISENVSIYDPSCAPKGSALKLELKWKQLQLKPLQSVLMALIEITTGFLWFYLTGA